MPHPRSEYLREMSGLDYCDGQEVRNAADELDRLHEIEAAWLWCSENGFPHRIWMPGKWNWYYSTFPRFDSPLEAVQSARKALDPAT